MQPKTADIYYTPISLAFSSFNTYLLERIRVITILCAARLHLVLFNRNLKKDWCFLFCRVKGGPSQKKYAMILI